MGAGLHEALLRVRLSAPPALQLTVATLAAYAVAHYLFGQATPVLTATTTISSLGFARDARFIKVLESSIAIVTGMSVLVIIQVSVNTWLFRTRRC